MSTFTLRPFGVLLVATWVLACAPEAEFKGGGGPADTTGPDLEVAGEVDETVPGEAVDAAAATCETDDDCKEAWKDVSFPCHTPVCGAGGTCEWQPDQDQDPCDDHNDCTENDACLDGQCVGDPVICDQGDNPCVATVCARGQGCTSTRNTTAPCDDGDACTVGDTCADGTCKAGTTTVTCNDDNVCTTDKCEAGACVYTPEPGPCDDDNPCTTDDACAGGLCVATGWSPCSELADLPCRRKVCDPVTGCGYVNLADGDACDDGNACSLGDYCVGGECTGPIERPCVDDDPCTADGCKPSAGCWFQQIETNGACDDGNPCTTGEVCQGGDCQGSEVACDDDDPCTYDYCDPLGAGCVADQVDGLACSDGNPCTLGDTCQAGACKSGLSLPCDDGNPCTTDSCGQVGGSPTCIFVPSMGGKSCDDGNPCTTNDQCAPGKGTCTGGTPKTCNDGNPCTLDVCNPKTGECLFAPVADDTPCSTDDVCFENPRCLDGACSGDPLPCDDDDLCTADSCDPESGCQHVPAVLEPDAVGCATLGPCEGRVVVTCDDNVATCDYTAVEGYEPVGEVSCDDRDNDCDGRVDEELCGVCRSGDRVCAGNDVLVCNATGYGWEFERACAGGASCVGNGACLPAGQVVAAADADPDPSRSHNLAVDSDGRLLAAIPLLDQGARTVSLRRVVPDTQVSEPVSTWLGPLAPLGDVAVVGMATTDGRRVHVVSQSAGGVNLDQYVRVIEHGALVVETDLSVPGPQAVAPPLTLNGTTLVNAMATITSVEAEMVLRVEQFDFAGSGLTIHPGLPYTGFLVEFLAVARQMDGDLALLATTNTQKAMLSRFRFASHDLQPLEELPDGPLPIELGAAQTAPFVALFEQDPLGTVTTTTRALDGFVQNGTGLVGATATPAGRVRAWGRDSQVLVLWEGGSPAAPEIGAALVNADGTVDPFALPDVLVGFDPRYGRSPLGFEWISWRTAEGEVRFLAL